MKKILKLTHADIRLPKVWNEDLYFSALYQKNINEVKGYFEVGWTELKTLNPAKEIKWPNKMVYFKLKLEKPVDNVIPSRIVGFDEINKCNNRILHKPHARQIITVKLDDVSIQLQMLYARIEELSTKNLTKFRNDMTKLVTEKVPNTSEAFFNSYIDGFEQYIGKQIKTYDELYEKVGLIKIIKCKVIN